MAETGQTALKRLPACQRCGGQLVRRFEDINCLQCGAVHTKDYRLVMRLPEEKTRELPVRTRRYSERKRPYYY